MKLSRHIPVTEISEKYGLRLLGNHNQLAFGINEIHKVVEGDITFVDAEKYYSKSIQSNASIILINKEADFPEHKTLLICDNPFEVYNSIILENRPESHETEKISQSAFIHPTAIVHNTAVIGAYAVIGPYAKIEANVIISEFSVIGAHSCIQAGAIIGSDAFYYKKTNKGFIKWRSAGRTIIQNHVEIGAGSTINKGVSGDTIIGEGTKIDCQVHIGHGVVVGKNCLFAAQVGIGGKTIIGDNVVLYGKVGLTQNLTIGNNVVVLAASGVSKDIPDGKTYFGAPAEEISIKYRELASLRQLPKIIKEMQKNRSGE
ncbi:MAG: UDP-3-O-(3-hydroxymyristoyl)glucosamine N-acyltransferase [Saprospiraceae bacterium]|nr:UDP-3-O-(3-hydroxymyristoyl)glucosamine N-acyltransferase [Saprospiraceae bacterium]